MRLPHFGLCLLATAISTCLYANEDTTNASLQESKIETKLPTIVMTATRTPKSIAEVAGTVQTIGGEEIA
ncbi:MAG: hypothetical protein RR966_14570, partial [Acinetobacter sp.]